MSHDAHPSEPTGVRTQDQHGRVGRHDVSPLTLRFDSPFVGREWPANGFVGAWSPRRRLQVQGTGLDEALTDDHWFLLGAGQRVHRDESDGMAVAFHGYVINPPLHQASPSAVITTFWKTRRESLINGIFSAAVIDPRATELTLRTDAFGFTPLYYRVLSEAVLFATNADYLVTPDTDLDHTALVSILSSSLIVGEQSLFADIHRVPLGGALTFDDPAREPRCTRHDLAVAGSGDQPLTEDRLQAFEGLLCQAVERCLALDHGPPLIALSGGLDSRRVLGALLAAGRKPPAIIMRIKQHDDVDAAAARAVAEATGLRHMIVDLPEPVAHARDNDIRRRAFGAETPMHHCAMTLQRAYPETPAMIFKGFLGDTLQECLHFWEGIYDDPRRDLEHILRERAATPAAAMLASTMPTGECLQKTVREQLLPYMDRRHIADLAELILTDRRGIATDSQIVRPWHLEVHPFADIDTMRAYLDLDPRVRKGMHLRRTLLERFHPELARVAATAPYADRPVTRPDTHQRLCARAYMTRITRDVPRARQRKRWRELLSPRGRAIVAMTRLAPARAERWYWATRPLFEAALHRERTPSVWRLA